MGACCSKGAEAAIVGITSLSHSVDNLAEGLTGYVLGNEELEIDLPRETFRALYRTYQGWKRAKGKRIFFLDFLFWRSRVE